MPNITAAGTYKKSDPGFEGLGKDSKGNKILCFAGTSAGDTCKIEYIDDEGVVREVENGSVTSLPWSKIIKGSNNRTNLDLQVTTTGTPDFNLTIV